MANTNASTEGGIKLYTLLYHDPTQVTHSNMKERGRDAFDIFVLCAAAAARWANEQGNSLQIVTNDAGFIRERLAVHGHSNVPVVSMDFSLDVPEKIAFRSCHFRLELLQRFGTGEFGDLVGVIDSDIYFKKPIKEGIIDGCDFVAHDITANIEREYGRESIDQCTELLAGRAIPNARYYGGEFLVARAAGFKQLAAHLQKVWPRYLRHLPDIDHTGDEPVFSAALNLAAEDGCVISDAAALKLITRWWSCRILYPQRRFEEITDHAILHFPADKALIARAALEPQISADFLRYYRPYARRKVLLRTGANILDKMRRRRGKFAPRM
jgi:hypothetical protein